ncbi:MAG: SIMPL domain-containing protein [Bacteroidota bacterium]
MKHLCLASFVLFSSLALAQETKPKARSIEVKGSSEIEITPDEIFLRITLKEYKKAGNKVNLNTLESQLVRSIKKLGIAKENLTVENVSGYNWNWRKRKAEDFLASKSFILEVSDLKKMNDLVGMLDPEGLNSMNVQSYSHSAIETYRRQVKIGAMKAAKDKAMYLLESVGADLGDLLEVQEIDYGYQSPMRMKSNMALAEANDSSYQSDVDFMKIKLRAEMRVVFGIKN